MKEKMVKIWTRNYNTIFMASIVWALNFEAKKFLGKQFESAIGSADENKVTFWMSEKEDKEYKKIIVDRFIKDLKSFNAYRENYGKFRKKFELVLKKINSQNLKKVANKQLAEMYRKFYETDFEFMLWGQYVAFALIEMVPQILKERLLKEKISVAEIEKTMFIVLSPSKIKAVTKMEDEILDFALKARQGNLPEEKYAAAIKSLVQKYGWIPSMTPDEPVWGKDFFAGRVKEAKDNPNLEKLIKESLEIKKEIVENKKKFKKLLAGYPRLRELLIVAKGLTDLKDGRDEARRHIYFSSRPLFQEIAARAKLSVLDMITASQFEVYKFLSKGIAIPLDEIKARQKNFVIFMKGRDFEIYSGKKAADYIKKYLEEKDGGAKEKFSGIIASRGLVRARVRIILDKKDLPYIKQGEVLVAVTTHPDYLSAMRRACAIVTDEGGLTSHAAIVSREFKIPCLVGTKIATKTLKTGDMVEVDANKGVVKIIK
jgi:phosphoenolpyruvate synthase/pyruvate phosphate dikinase